VFGVLVGLGFRLIFSSKPGQHFGFEPMMSSFTLLVPIVVGAVTVYVAERVRRRTWPYYFWVGAGANASCLGRL